MPSWANFVTTDMRRPAGPVQRAMEADGVLVRGLIDPGYGNYLRITVGLAAENARALAALRAALVPGGTGA